MLPVTTVLPLGLCLQQEPPVRHAFLAFWGWLYHLPAPATWLGPDAPRMGITGRVLEEHPRQQTMASPTSTPPKLGQRCCCRGRSAFMGCRTDVQRQGQGRGAQPCLRPETLVQGSLSLCSPHASLPTPHLAVGPHGDQGAVRCSPMLQWCVLPSSWG